MKMLIPAALLFLTFVGIGHAQEKVIDKAAFDVLMQHHRRPPAEWQTAPNIIISAPIATVINP